MEKLVSMMTFGEGTLDVTVAPSGAVNATGGCNNVVAFLAAAAKKYPMKKLVATMAFCEAPFDGTFDGTTSAPSSDAAASATTGGGKLLASLAAAAKKRPVEKLVATMAFCEAPFDGTFDGTTSALSSGAAGTNVPGDGEGEDPAALRRVRLADYKKQWPLREHPLLLREMAGSVVGGLAIFETIALQ